MLEHRSVNMCCDQEGRWKGDSVRFAEGREAGDNLFWIHCSAALASRTLE